MGGGESDMDSYNKTTLGWGGAHLFKSDSARGVKSSKLHYRQLCIQIAYAFKGPAISEGGPEGS